MSAEKGDVIIRKKGRKFTLEVCPAPPQVLVKDYEEAVQVARGFARKTNAAIWFAKGRGDTVELKKREEP